MNPTHTSPRLHRIIIVGGGAGGLELATRLGDKLGKRRQAQVTLIDRVRTHLWKPKLHEVAAGSMDLGLNEVSYRAQAHWHGFTFAVGEMTGLDRERKLVHVAAFVDEDNVEITPARSIPYDTLVIAIGSQSNDFGTPGVSEHAMKLETTADARVFHRRLINAGVRAHTQAGPMKPGQLQVAIIGAGATGVELAAELHRSTRVLVSYGLDRIDPDKDLNLHVIEAAPRVLPGLPERLSIATLELLRGLDVQVHVNSKVAAIEHERVVLADGRAIDAELIVWAAGVKAPDFLKDIAGLETNRINQLVVTPTLQATRDDNIFAFGDCAACLWPQANPASGGTAPTGSPRTVPPRAQAAHQQASHLVKQIQRRMAKQPLVPYTYRDFGSLVSLGEYSTVGNMMGGLIGGSLMIEGLFAKGMYLSLYKMHELALHGFPKVALDTLARMITRRTEPHVKLH